MRSVYSNYFRRIRIAGLQMKDGPGMITVKSTQKVFTEDEISTLTGICTEHLHAVARSKHLGTIARAAGAAGGQVERLLFSYTD